MKYYSSLKMYKANNVCFDPNKLEAYSYSWWRFVEKIGNRIIFNNYGYSVSTRRHQNKVWILLNNLNINIDIKIEAPEGLQHLGVAREYYNNKIHMLQKELLNKKLRKPEIRIDKIKEYSEKVRLICDLIKERGY